MSKTWVGSIVVAICLVCAGSARADSVVISGLELQVPASWGATTKGKATMLAPKRYKGRGIELIPIPVMPAATPEAIGKLLASEKIKVTKVAPLERNGFTGVAVVGQVTTDKGTVDMDVLIVPVKDSAVMITSFIMTDQDPVLRQANTDILLSARVAGPKITVTFEAPKKGEGIPKEFVDGMQLIAPGLDKVFLLPRPLPIHIQSCGFINAFYSPKTHSITLCHELWDDLVKLFTDVGMDRAKALKLTAGTYMFAFFHEFGHALVGELGLPITGKGEDAADEIATLVLSGIPAGQKAALNAAQWFDTMNAQTGHRNLFWDEHSFDEQRSVAILCLLYGSNAKVYEPLMKAKGIPAQRAARCTRDYGDRLAAWNKLLEPYHRKPGKK